MAGRGGPKKDRRSQRKRSESLCCLRFLRFLPAESSRQQEVAGRAGFEIEPIRGDGVARLRSNRGKSTLANFASSSECVSRRRVTNLWTLKKRWKTVENGQKTVRKGQKALKKRAKTVKNGGKPMRDEAKTMKPVKKERDSETFLKPLHKCPLMCFVVAVSLFAIGASAALLT